MLLLGILFGWRRRGALSRETWVVIGGFWMFVLGGLLSLVNNQNWDFAAWRFEKYYPFLLVPLILSLLQQDRQDERRIRIFLWAAVVAAFSVAVFALLNDSPRTGLGKNLNPNRFGAYAFWLSVIIAAAIFVLRRNRVVFATMLAALAASFYAGLASGSRGSLLGLIAGFLVMALSWVFKPYSHRKLWGGIGGFALVVSVLGGVILTDTSWQGYAKAAIENTEEFFEGKHKNTPTGIRLMMWSGAIEIWKEHPIVGTGLGDPRDDLDAWIENSGSVLDKAYSRFHSIYFDSLASTGTFGIVTMLVGVLILPFRYFLLAYYRAPKGTLAEFSALAGAGTVALYAVVGLTGSWLFNRGMPPYLVAVVVLISGTVIFRKPEDEGTGSHSMG